MAGDQLLTKSPIELDINSNVVWDRDNSIMDCIVEMTFENIIIVGAFCWEWEGS